MEELVRTEIQGWEVIPVFPDWKENKDHLENWDDQDYLASMEFPVVQAVMDYPVSIQS